MSGILWQPARAKKAAAGCRAKGRRTPFLLYSKGIFGHHDGMIQAYCFDLDGTLLDLEAIWVEAIRAYLADETGDFPLHNAERLVFGRSWRDIHAEIVATTPLDMSIEAMEAAVAPYYRRIAGQRDIRIHSSIELLKRLAADTPVCIVSGSSRKTVGEAVAMMKIGSYLAFYLGADDYAPGKPDPACYRLAARKLDLPPRACLVFEDSNAGVRAARAAGMPCVALAAPGRTTQELAEADLVLDDLGQFSLDALCPGRSA